MHRRSIITLLLINCWPLICGAQLSHQLFPYRGDEKWGYCDKRGKVIIKPRWDKVEPFGHSSAKVYIGKTQPTTCLIDGEGNYIIPPEMHWTGYFSANTNHIEFNAFDSNGHAGIVDTNGKIIVPVIYDAKHANATRLNGSHYQVYKNDNAGVLNLDGSVVLPCKYKLIAHTSPSRHDPPYFWVLYDSTTALVDTNGYEHVSIPVYNAAVSFRFLDTNNNAVLSYDHKHWVWPDFPNGKRREVAFEMGRFRSDHQEIYPHLYLTSQIKDQKQQWGIADVKGNVLLRELYDGIYADTGGILIVEKRLENDNPDERYEFVYLDTATLQPTGPPERSARSGIETYKREKEKRKNIYQQFNVVVDKTFVDSIIYLQSSEVAYQKGAHFIQIMDHANRHSQYREHTKHGAYLPVAVFDTTTKQNIGYTLADDSLNIAHAPQPYYIAKVNINKTKTTLVLIKDEQQALTDKNFNMLIDFQPEMLNSGKYFEWQRKGYIIVSRNKYSSKPSMKLLNSSGQVASGFEQYNYVVPQSLYNAYGHDIDRLGVKDPNGKMGIVDLNGKELYPDISFKYENVGQINENLFLVSDDKGQNRKIVDQHNHELFPGITIISIMPVWAKNSAYNEEYPIPGVYEVVQNNDPNNYQHFYMNDKGKAFAKSVNVTARPER